MASDERSHTSSSRTGALEGRPEGPTLSLILCARNDSYQGNSIWRLETALNYVGRSAADTGRLDDVEVIVADWGSDVPLRDTLELTREAAAIVRFMTITPDIARTEQKDSPFPEVLALNGAARRARGAYIGRIDQDTLVGEYFLERIFWLLEKRRLLVPIERAMMLSNRRRISVRFTAKSPSVWAVHKFVRLFGRFLPLMNPLPPELFYQSYVGIWLLHRDLWERSGGYDERFIYMDWQEVDMMLRLTEDATLVNLGELTGHDLYHLDHGPARVVWSSQRNRKCNPIRDFDHLPDEAYPNKNGWGLTQYSLDPVPYPAEKALQQRFGARLVQLPVFVGLTLIASVQILGDMIISTPTKWRGRLKVAFRTVSGRPVASWPGLLMTRWRERHAYRE